ESSKIPISANDISNFTIPWCDAKINRFVAYGGRRRMASEDLELVARGVSVQFDGLRALSGVTLTVPRGRITGLIGPNGAGKTTLINVLTGFQSVDAGSLMLEGEAVNGILAHQL